METRELAHWSVCLAALKAKGVADPENPRGSVQGSSRDEGVEHG